jgi:hypothetical protein
VPLLTIVLVAGDDSAPEGGVTRVQATLDTTIRATTSEAAGPRIRIMALLDVSYDRQRIAYQGRTSQ